MKYMGICYQFLWIIKKDYYPREIVLSQFSCMSIWEDQRVQLLKQVNGLVTSNVNFNFFQYTRLYILNLEFTNISFEINKMDLI